MCASQSPLKKFFFFKHACRTFSQNSRTRGKSQQQWKREWINVAAQRGAETLGQFYTHSSLQQLRVLDCDTINYRRLKKKVSYKVSAKYSVLSNLNKLSTIKSFVGVLGFPPNILFLLVTLMTSFWTYVLILEIPLIQFGCLLLVCPLLCFFLLFVVVCFSSFTGRKHYVSNATLSVPSYITRTEMGMIKTSFGGTQITCHVQFKGEIQCWQRERERERERLPFSICYCYYFYSF